MFSLNPSLQSYSWGSKTLIADLRGEESPTQHPQDELWYGAHPAAPADIAGVPLQEGFRRENAQGIDVRAGNRNYRDDNHKPELIVALTPFHAMAGFRPLAATLELFAALDCPSLARYVGMIDSTGEEAVNLRMLFTTWITIPAAVRKQLIDDIIVAAKRVVAEGSAAEWQRETLANIIELDTHYPGDVGVLGALLLNYVRLEPGEGIYLDAGNLHAYCRGLGVEVMANSDNVLRGGLTAKHVDVPELARVLRFTSLVNPRTSNDTGWFEVPVEEFDMRMVTATEESPWSAQIPGPRVVLCTAGHVTVTVGPATQVLHPTGYWRRSGFCGGGGRTLVDALKLRIC